MHPQHQDTLRISVSAVPLSDEEGANEENNARVEGKLLKTIVICGEIVESDLKRVVLNTSHQSLVLASSSSLVLARAKGSRKR